MKRTLFYLSAVMAGVLAACGSKEVGKPEPAPKPTTVVVEDAPDPYVIPLDPYDAPTPQAPEGASFYFRTDKHNISDRATDRLDELAQTLIVSGRSVEITGFADRRGPSDYNLTLSHKRACAVRDYLLREGVDPDQIFATYSGGEIDEGQLATDRRATVEELVW